MEMTYIGKHERNGKMTVAQVLAILIFCTMFVLMVLECFEKHFITIGAGVLTIGLVFGAAMQSKEAIQNTLNVQSIFTKDFWIVSGEAAEESSGINWARFTKEYAGFTPPITSTTIFTSGSFAIIS